MVIYHTSDLHIGKLVNGFSMLEDQQHVFEQVLQHVHDHRPDAFIIAGDVYDRQVPSADAVTLLDDFLTQLSRTDTSVYIISGNHDSAERLSFASRIMAAGNIYIAGGFKGSIEQHILRDEYGDVVFHLLPFFRPSIVRRYLEAESYDSAFANIIAQNKLDESKRNILIAHQFMLCAGVQPSRFDSETASVGGTDAVDVSPAFGYDYVALGHLHGAQAICHQYVRYSGSPLKYSFSEHRHTKSMLSIQLKQKGDIEIDTIPLHPLHDMRVIKGNLDALSGDEAVQSANCEDYIHAILTDDYIVDAMDRLRSVYPNLMSIDFDNKRTRAGIAMADLPLRQAQLSLPDMFGEFYTRQNAQQLTDEQRNIIIDTLSQSESAL